MPSHLVLYRLRELRERISVQVSVCLLHILSLIVIALLKSVAFFEGSGLTVILGIELSLYLLLPATLLWLGYLLIHTLRKRL